MDNLAMMIAAIFAGFAGLLVGFYAFARSIMSDARKERKEEQKSFTEALDRMADASVQVATATTQSALEAKQRNGHLGEQNESIARMLSELSKGNQDRAEKNHKELVGFMNTLHLKLDNQTVKEQHVKTQIIEGQE